MNKSEISSSVVKTFSSPLGGTDTNHLLLWTSKVFTTRSFQLPYIVSLKTRSGRRDEPFRTGLVSEKM